MWCLLLAVHSFISTQAAFHHLRHAWLRVTMLEDHPPSLPPPSPLPSIVPELSTRAIDEYFSKQPEAPQTESSKDGGSSGTTSEVPHRAGFVSILGVPNVGKSTLMNSLLGEKLSIATSKAQTTRHRIMGIDNGADYQIVYSDTPGMLRPQYKLQEGMMSFVRSSVVDADVVLLVVDIFQDVGDAFPDEKLLRALRGTPAAVLVLLNKADLLADPATHAEDHSPERFARLANKVNERTAEYGTLDEIARKWRGEFPGSTVLPISAKRGHGIDDVMRHCVALLPEHPPFYDKEQLTDKPERFFAAEFLREAIFEQYHEEVPYSCECRIEAFKETDALIRIRAVIFVSHESQKGIVIGKKGAALKKVGTRARARLEDFFQKQIFLETRVKVRPNWRQDLKSLEEFGYV